MSNSIVSLSEQAFFTIITAALEAFQVDHSKREDGTEIHLETFGNLWGHETALKHGAVVYHVTSADVSTSASREKTMVIPKDEAYALKSNFINYFFPELKYLGDYHSHPYSCEQDNVRSELELERQQLYQFSTGDFNSVSEERAKFKKNYRVGLVVTVYQRDEPTKRADQWMDDLSCIRFQYDNLTLWVKAYVWAGNDYRKRADKKVNLICPALGFSLRNIKVAE